MSTLKKIKNFFSSEQFQNNFILLTAFAANIMQFANSKKDKRFFQKEISTWSLTIFCNKLSNILLNSLFNIDKNTIESSLIKLDNKEFCLKKMIEDVAIKMKVKEPKLILLKSEMINAAAAKIKGDKEKKYAIVIFTGILEHFNFVAETLRQLDNKNMLTTNNLIDKLQLNNNSKNRRRVKKLINSFNKEESKESLAFKWLEGILYHEFAHIKKNHHSSQSMYSFLSDLLFLRNINIKNFFKASFIKSVFDAYFSKNCEYEADKESIKYGKNEDLSDALLVASLRKDKIQTQFTSDNSFSENFSNAITFLFSSHPSLENRQKVLLKKAQYRI